MYNRIILPIFFVILSSRPTTGAGHPHQDAPWNRLGNRCISNATVAAFDPLAVNLER